MQKSSVLMVNKCANKGLCAKVIFDKATKTTLLNNILICGLWFSPAMQTHTDKNDAAAVFLAELVCRCCF